MWHRQPAPPSGDLALQWVEKALEERVRDGFGWSSAKPRNLVADLRPSGMCFGSRSNDSQTHVLAPITSSQERGPSDFDIRDGLSGALTYDIPGRSYNGFLNALAENWGVDLILTVQSAPRVNVLSSTAPLFGVTSALRPNVVPECRSISTIPLSRETFA